MRLFVLLLLLLSLPAWADTPARITAVTAGGVCRTYRLCNAETDTTAACDEQGDNVVAIPVGVEHGFYFDQSTATTFACNVYTSSNGYQASARTKLFAADFDTSQYFQGLENVVLEDVWVECSTITGGNVTAFVKSCVSSR